MKKISLLLSLFFIINSMGAMLNPAPFYQVYGTHIQSKHSLEESQVPKGNSQFKSFQAEEIELLDMPVINMTEADLTFNSYSPQIDTSHECAPVQTLTLATVICCGLGLGGCSMAAVILTLFF